MTALTIIAFASSSAVFAGIVILGPRLAIRPAIRSAMWRLRDEISSARRHGELSFEDEIPMALIHRIEAAILASDQLTVAGMILAAPSIGRIPPAARAEIEAHLNPDIRHFSSNEKKLYIGFDNRFKKLMVANVFLGSWSGLASLAVFIPLAFGAFVAAKVSENAGVSVRKKVRERRVLTEEMAFEISYTARENDLLTC